MNLEIVAGVTPSSENDYEGGIDGLVRFAEDWSGCNFTIYGGIAAAYPSLQFTGRWSSASHAPPQRFWYHDPLFLSEAPPGLPTMALGIPEVQ